MKLFYLSPFLALAAFLIPAETMDALARVLVPGIALMATGVFPCMTLVVNAMKGEHRTPAMVDELHLKLKQLLKLLVVTFALAVFAMIVMAWSVALVKAPVLDWVPRATFAIAVLATVLLVGRLEAIGRVFFALLEINRKHSLLIARAKVRGERDMAIEAGKLARVPEDDPEPRPLRRVG